MTSFWLTNEFLLVNCSEHFSVTFLGSIYSGWCCWLFSPLSKVLRLSRIHDTAFPVSSFLPTCYLTTALMRSSFLSFKCWYFQGSLLVHLLFTFSRVFLDELFHSCSFTYPSAGCFFFNSNFPLAFRVIHIKLIMEISPWKFPDYLKFPDALLVFFFQLLILEIWYHPCSVCPLPLLPHCGPVNSTPLKSYFHSPSLQLSSYLTTVVSHGLLQEPLYFSNHGQNKLSKVHFQ